MKRIRIFGCQGRDRRKALIRDATEFFRNKLLPRKRKLDISIYLRKHLKKCYNVYGDCEVKDDTHSYVINLDLSLSNKDLIKTLGHEMIHVKQYAIGDLGMWGNKWCGKKYPIDMPYDDQPWEKEAMALEDILYYQYITTNMHK